MGLQVWCEDNLRKQTPYQLNRTLVNISKKWSSAWDLGVQMYWATYYNKVEEEMIKRGVL